MVALLFWLASYRSDCYYGGWTEAAFIGSLGGVFQSARHAFFGKQSNSQADTSVAIHITLVSSRNGGLFLYSDPLLTRAAMSLAGYNSVSVKS